MKRKGIIKRRTSWKKIACFFEPYDLNEISVKRAATSLLSTFYSANVDHLFYLARKDFVFNNILHLIYTNIVIRKRINASFM